MDLCTAVVARIPDAAFVLRFKVFPSHGSSHDVRQNIKGTVYIPQLDTTRDFALHVEVHIFLGPSFYEDP
eukprot:2036223-Pleurochrysis_carterae.AAC.4